MRQPQNTAARPIYRSNMDHNPYRSTIYSSGGSGSSGAGAQQPCSNWLAVLAITLGVFAFTTTEMVPVGLLIPISNDLHVSQGMTGLAVTLYGLIAGVLAPVLTATTRQLDRRLLLAGVLGIFVLGNTCTAFATTYVLLMIARLVTGFAHGLMWSIAASIAVRLVPEKSAVKAIAIVFSGISIAFVLGIPLGTLIGGLTHWRVVFAVVGMLGAISLAAVVLLLPKMPPTSTLNLSELPRLLANTRLRAGLLVTAIVVTGHFSAYTYISPYLEQVAKVNPQWISSLLLLYGVASVIGNFVAGSCAAKALRTTLVVAITVIAGSILLLLAVGDALTSVVVLVICWGFAFAALPLCLQTLVLRSAPGAPEAASSVFICSFNVTIAFGAFIGGYVLDRFGPSAVMALGAALCIGAAVALAALYRERAAVPVARSISRTHSSQQIHRKGQGGQHRKLA